MGRNYLIQEYSPYLKLSMRRRDVCWEGLSDIFRGTSIALSRIFKRKKDNRSIILWFCLIQFTSYMTLEVKEYKTGSECPNKKWHGQELVILQISRYDNGPRLLRTQTDYLVGACQIPTWGQNKLQISQSTFSFFRLLQSSMELIWIWVCLTIAVLILNYNKMVVYHWLIFFDGLFINLLTILSKIIVIDALTLITAF